MIEVNVYNSGRNVLNKEYPGKFVQEVKGVLDEKNVSYETDIPKQYIKESSEEKGKDLISIGVYAEEGKGQIDDNYVEGYCLDYNEEVLEDLMRRLEI
ncbi:hypothetical protein MM300_10105 [Evansella sp. LMS18]|jgi:hypothetical protein|uniref:hypothetical protein n=1 Tax=Evansella sp. LMS18 TaxID=2924033 RepID=UPI0020D183B6|nr:hypothetical protein [Evansella sp. LMS18]UTR12590.1 hypothetical protein MM300_10105 [Evansella sp. LMS18]